MAGIMNTLNKYFTNLFKDIYKLIKTYPKTFIGIILSILFIYVIYINIDIIMPVFHLCPNGDYVNDICIIFIFSMITILYNGLIAFLCKCIYDLCKPDNDSQYKTLLNTLKYIVTILVTIFIFYYSWKYLIIPLWKSEQFTIFY